ncbi:hypothetical protein C5167_044021 [Papaver somniferum]|uniref:Uncharacterized protein n=1 Tax=Papaver somniferum TaxID=3469 RepID=A0A4Y7L7F3_PAPSO|nr:hypothetical protein C5167_044021 [Papaver somniferum]
MEHRNFLESGELSVIYVGHGIGITSPPGRIPKFSAGCSMHHTTPENCAFGPWEMDKLRSLSF